jgi:putative methyltransferase
MKKNVTFIELPVFTGVVPLASGYMEVCCRKDPVLAESYTFEKISLAVTTPYAEILAALTAAAADVYAFSCYVWNTGMVRRLLDALLIARPRAHFVLGGPQVMHEAGRYLSPAHTNVFVCNGEGERTFPNILRALLADERDYSTVRGLSFYADGRLVTTPPEPRISDISEIPSPFLEGVFEKNRYSWMLIETNRGCPFKCNYCYWGSGATGVRVYKYDEERIKQELLWISQARCWYLFIADANWGMLKRDVELSRYIVECQQQYGSPLSVYFCGSKNTPDRVAEITRIFHDAGMISTQSVALQTMNPETLIRVNRDNIKTSAYIALQDSINEQKLSSFIELIWPLPGETLRSFQEGLASLCSLRADSFVVYPLLLMNNVELASKRDEYGLVTVRDPDPNGEAEIVVQTSEVDLEAYRAGLRYTYVVLSLYVLRGLWHLGRYLHDRGLMSYGDLYRGFVDFYLARPSHPFTRFCEESIAKLENTTFSNTGALLHLVLHTEREAFDRLLEEFFAQQPFAGDRGAQFLFEVDLVHRPYIYRNTPVTAKGHRFTHLRVIDVQRSGYVVEIPPQFAELGPYLSLPHAGHAAGVFEVNHRRAQLPFMPAKSLHEHFMYCQDMSQRAASFVPEWKAAATTVAAR